MDTGVDRPGSVDRPVVAFNAVMMIGVLLLSTGVIAGVTSPAFLASTVFLVPVAGYLGYGLRRQGPRTE